MADQEFLIALLHRPGLSGMESAKSLVIVTYALCVCVCVCVCEERACQWQACEGIPAPAVQYVWQWECLRVSSEWNSQLSTK